MNHGGMQNTFAQNAKALMREWAGSRKQVSLWLDLKINKDYETLEIIEYLKSKREFRRSAMLGLKIVWELRQGCVTTLLQEFPQIKEWLKVNTTPSSDGGGGQLEDINAKLDMLIAKEKTGGYVMQSALPQTAIAPPVAVVSAAVAVSADDVASNFLSMFD